MMCERCESFRTGRGSDAVVRIEPTLASARPRRSGAGLTGAAGRATKVAIVLVIIVGRLAIGGLRPPTTRSAQAVGRRLRATRHARTGRTRCPPRALLTAHAEKERAAGNYKHGYGFHPLGCWLDETGEALAAILRPGNAGSNTAEDHFTVLGLALEQLPAEDLDREILVRTDIGGCTHAFTADCRDAQIRFSVGYELSETVRAAILEVPETAWQQAINGDGEARDGAWVAELTDRLNLTAWPEGSRLIVRRERPHPGAQFTIFDEHGYRHTCFLTDQDGQDIAALELRHRGRARVEDSIRAGKDTGMRNLPHHAFEHNQAWLEISLIAQDLLTWTKLICLDGELAIAEPKRLRHRLLHTAGRVVRHGRRTRLRLQADWPWAPALVAAFARLRAIPTLC